MKNRLLVLMASILLIAGFTLIFSQCNAQGIKISALPTLSAPDSSADLIPIVHSGTTYKITPGRLFHEFGAAGGGGGSLPATEIGFGTGSGISSSDLFTYDESTSVLTLWQPAQADYSLFIDNDNGFATLNMVNPAGDATGYIDIDATTSNTIISQWSLVDAGSNNGAARISLYADGTGPSLSTITHRLDGYDVLKITDNALYVLSKPSAVTQLRLYEGTTNGTNFTGFQSPVSRSTTLVYTLPTTDPSSGDVLIAGVPSGGNVGLAWATVAGAAGSDGEIQYNDGSGGFAASADFTWNNTTKEFTVASAGNASLRLSPGNNQYWLGDVDLGGYGPYLFVDGFGYKNVLYSGTQSGTMTSLTTALTYVEIAQTVNSGGTGELRILEDPINGVNYTGFKTTASRSGNLIYALPSTDPTSGQVLSAGAPSGGVSALSWATPSNPGDAAADASTKGVATFAINDFNSSAGLISIDYTNGQAATTSAKGFLTDTDWDLFNSATTRGIDDVLAEGQALTAARTIDLATNLLDFNSTGGATTININAGINVSAGGTGAESYIFNAGSDYVIRSSGTDGDALINLGDYNDAAKAWIKVNPPASTITLNAPSGIFFNHDLAVTGNISATNLTLGGNFTTSGANALTFTTVGATNVTLPTSGTLVTSGVTTLSSLTSVGTIGTGTWQGSVIAGQYGGTGVANTGKTITVSGNTTIGSSTNTVAFATSGNTSVTLPTSGTLATYAEVKDADISGVSTIAFTAGVAPTTLTGRYSWCRISNIVFCNIRLEYGSAGSTVTAVTVTIPSDMPTPAGFTGWANSEFGFPVTAEMYTSVTGSPVASRGFSEKDGSGNYRVGSTCSSNAVNGISFSFQYFVN